MNNIKTEKNIAETEEILDRTQSLCPVCLARIPAEKVKIGDNVYLRKTCPDHDSFQTVIWRGKPDYMDWVKEKKPEPPKVRLSETDKGCPFDCGLCPEHFQQVCCAQFEVTQRCNLQCPVCFADAGKVQENDPTMEELLEQMKLLRDAYGPCNIQLSGGEPTLRDDLPDIINNARSLGYTFFQLNTNGIRLAHDLDYVKTLKEAGLSTVFLQFDGTKDEIYRKLRGKDLMAIKQKAIENCGRHKLGVVLVPTLVPGINTDNIGDIIHYALQGMPVIRGVHFQPISYFGRYPLPPKDEDRITLPEVLRAIEDQTEGLLKVENFGPSDCEDTRCSFHGDFIYFEDGKLTPLTRKQNSCCCSPNNLQEDSVRRAQNFVATRWVIHENFAPINFRQNNHQNDQFDRLLDRIWNYRISITCMAFQDVENIDLKRLKYCCIQVVKNGKTIPFCAYNLSSRDGQPLHRGK